MSQREWVGMCKDAKIPVPIGEINDAHRRCDRATKEEKEEAKKKGGAARSDKQLNLGEFLEGFASEMHEPFYRDYLRDDLAPLVNDAGFARCDVQRAWLSKVVSATGGQR